MIQRVRHRQMSTLKARAFCLPNHFQETWLPQLGAKDVPAVPWCLREPAVVSASGDGGEQATCRHYRTINVCSRGRTRQVLRL